MVNISSVSRLAGKALTVLKPTTRKIGMVSIFGAGVLAGSLLTQNSSQTVNTPTEKTASANKVATAPKAEAKEKEFKYVPPKIGEDGIVKADTSYYAGTKQPEYIDYQDKNGHSIHLTNFDKNGKMSGFRIYTSDSGDYNGFNAKGEFTSSLENNADGSYTYGHKDAELGRWLEDKYDKNNRLTHYECVIDGKVESDDWTYHKDGSKTHKFSLTNNAITRDKNDKIIKEKQYDDNGVLKYTVVPKYNKDGDVIKNDTIRNNQ